MDFKAILFDMGGTLDSNGVSWYQRRFDIINDRFPWVFEAEYQTAEATAVEEHSKLENAGTLQTFSTVNSIMEKIFYQLHLPEMLAAPLAATLVGEASEHMINNRALIKRWRTELGLKTGVITNNYGNSLVLLDEHNMLDLFDTVRDSALLDMRKPDPEIFELALEDLDLPPSEVLFVGDDYEIDIVGAHRVGMQTAWLINKRSYFSRNMIGLPTYKLALLSDLTFYF